MKELYCRYQSEVDISNAVRRTSQLCRLEMKQTTPFQHRASAFIVDELKKAGVKNVELTSFPADGKTVWMDAISPLAWDVTKAKLTLCDADKTVAADYEVQPFNIVKGSCATAPGGEKLRIITTQQLLAGADPRNALVMLEYNMPPRRQYLTPILDMGCRGVISDYLRGRYRDVNAVQWVNASSEGPNWHVTCRDREFLNFSVSPYMGELIRNKANNGGLFAIAECDGRRYEDTMDVITALIPGRRKEEVWLLAHTCEPLQDDDSAGVSAGIEVARLMQQTGGLEYSLRVIFAVEVYGFAAYRANFKGKVIGACNIDSLPCRKGDPGGRFVTPPAAVPFHGVDIFRDIANTLTDEVPYRMRLTRPECFDDMFMSEPTAGVPTVWLFYDFDIPVTDDFRARYWHCSRQTADDYIDPDCFRASIALTALWCDRTLKYTGPQAPLRLPECRQVPGKWRDYAAEHIFARVGLGFPKDLAAVPVHERIDLPNSVMYGAFGFTLAYMDGKRNLAEAISMAESEYGVELDDSNIKRYISCMNFLADWGYLEAVRRPVITADMLHKVFSDVGVCRGDLLLFHSSVARCGYVEDGADTIIRTLRDILGPEGTLLVPTFTRPYINLGGFPNQNWLYRPYDAGKPSQIWTGKLPQVMLRNFPEAIRSRHITHSWAGFGAQAEACLSAHGAYEPPVGDTSPPAIAMKLGGKVLFYGADVNSCTFLHYLETKSNAPFLDNALCTDRMPDGSLKRVAIPQHLPGHRDFYRSQGGAEECKFFSRALAAGLELRKQKFGTGMVKLLELQEMYRIGMKLVEDDPRVLLCDNPDCGFCSRF